MPGAGVVSELATIQELRNFDQHNDVYRVYSPRLAFLHCVLAWALAVLRVSRYTSKWVISEAVRSRKIANKTRAGPYEMRQQRLW